MVRLLVVAIAITAMASSGCGDEFSCSLPEQWSAASSGDGSTCQINIFAPSEHAAFCGGSPGNWHCACGPLAENPMEFDSTDFCEVAPEERVCQAITRCGFQL